MWIFRHLDFPVLLYFMSVNRYMLSAPSPSNVMIGVHLPDVPKLITL